MELDKRALDRYITREPEWYDEEPIALKCAKCGRFLKQEPDGKREFVSIRHCDGQPHVLTGQKHDEAVLRIIGEEHRDDEFTIAYPPACGSKTASQHTVWDGEISESEIDEYKHEPHFFVEDVWGYLLYEIRTCVCGHINEEPML